MLHCELAQRIDLCELPFLLHREQIYLSSNKHGPSIDRFSPSSSWMRSWQESTTEYRQWQWKIQ